MCDASKLTLSAEELQLAGNTRWILTKRNIIEKTALLFGRLSAVMQQRVMELQGLLPPELVSPAPKIAKGENYLLLPYVILDYPRCFEKGHIFAIRTMFWWGNCISITLHVSGKYKNKIAQVLQTGSVSAGLKDYYICINEDEWQHHFEADNYIPLQQLTVEETARITDARHFIKVAAKFDLQQWNCVQALLEKEFEKLLQLATH